MAEIDLKTVFMDWCVGCKELSEITPEGYFNCLKLRCSMNKNVVGMKLSADAVELYEKNRLKR